MQKRKLSVLLVVLVLGVGCASNTTKTAVGNSAASEAVASIVLLPFKIVGALVGAAIGAASGMGFSGVD
ncbi:MAG: hypothetical protein JSR17_07290 [Proteobacteria bacterium]|nr:hypothetical protein [Pseudomonadota bacterium]